MDESKTLNRMPVVAGSFYSSDPEELQEILKKLFDQAVSPDQERNIRAVISPHAGYVFSGQVAASGFKQLDPNAEYDHIFLIGSSHHVSFEGASVYSKGNYFTPLGEVEVDCELANKLINDNDCFTFQSGAHSSEHSLEVQLPFLQYWLNKTIRIIPIMLATQNPEKTKEISKALLPYFNEKTLFVISTDLSHYPNYKDALEADGNMIDAIQTGSADKLQKAITKNSETAYPNLLTSMCGWTSVLCLLYLAEMEKELEFTKVQYLNSGDSLYKDKDRVVGYVSMILTRKNNP
ncbi:MAG: AmmeMemoRadiSam system protein B [Bacteroidota bacterium]|nr:AmmeMemoRadiSam system protein B [Bacteroidota bacterium]